MNTPLPAQKHIEQHASSFTTQPRFRRLKFKVLQSPQEQIVIEGYVGNVSDFSALKNEWDATRPPCVTSVFVHIDPQR